MADEGLQPNKQDIKNEQAEHRPASRADRFTWYADDVVIIEDENGVSAEEAGTETEEFYNAFHDKNDGRFAKGGPGGGGVRSASGDVRAALKSRGATEYIKGVGAQRPGEDIFSYQSRALDGLPAEIKHAVIARIRERPEPVQSVGDAQNKFLDAHGLPHPKVDWENETASYEKAQRVMEAIQKTPRDDNNPQYKAAYEDFKAQTTEMWSLLTKPKEEGGMGIKVEEWDERTRGSDNPYATSAAQSADVASGHLYMNRGEFFIGHNESSPTGTDHPFMTGNDYFKFRAVHDVFGHVAHGTGFDRHGEYLAWMSHNSMYTGEGRKAMSTEYHAVNTHLYMTGKPLPKNRWGTILPDSVIANVFDGEGNVVRK